MIGVIECRAMSLSTLNDVPQMKKRLMRLEPTVDPPVGRGQVPVLQKSKNLFNGRAKQGSSLNGR